MRSLRQSLRAFIARLARRGEGRVPEDDRPHARFLTSSSQFSRAKGYVRYAAFMPPKKRPELSVFRVDGLADSGVQPLAQRVAAESSRKVYGWAEFAALAVRLSGLKLVADEEPPRHAHIAGWPEEKDARQALASDLAEQSTLKHRGDPWIDGSGRVVA